ncbi:uncharacterized protein ACLA_021900 [Aspergillus clavatus NRRL 1]|uniref:Uncharacterized protein n=1 Tax=Aspergillus clavatus (strain ATCC 1007 / CBS 513.65 / DSM 816 / NCTC 3887 / NRRL 1 / QM 1276 / 107) TaxID=344612 RepID=A1CPA5_ASPCL|nr:uncharacterized protein ACLA_021900 [Aspergillus clavatus NRRL 1]EAW07476.1 conserved hypothetical protein [Aspergillus clavatus NRRL 1]
MPSNARIPSTTTKLKNMLTPRPPRVCILPLQSVWQPAGFPTPANVRARLNSSLGKEWKGCSPDEHAVRRTEKNRDTTDPEAEASASGMKERAEDYGIADDSKQQGATEREGRKFQRQAKEDHPKAPEPVIGMNDERARVSGAMKLEAIPASSWLHCVRVHSANLRVVYRRALELGSAEVIFARLDMRQKSMKPIEW